MYKNGVPYQETPGRVSFDHRGITFTKLNQEDAGEYRVRAWNTVGRASDSVVLRGEFIGVGEVFLCVSVM